jgi:hypothetical protein
MPPSTVAEPTKKTKSSPKPIYHPCTNDTPLVVQAACSWDFGLEFEGDFLFSKKNDNGLAPSHLNQNLTTLSIDPKGEQSMHWRDDLKPVLIMGGTTYRMMKGSEFDHFDKIVLSDVHDKALDLHYLYIPRFQFGVGGSDIHGGNSVSYNTNGYGKTTIFMNIPNGWFGPAYVNLGINLMKHEFNSEKKTFVIYGGKKMYNLYLNDKYLSNPNSDTPKRVCLLKIRDNNEIFNQRYNGRATAFFPMKTLEKYYKIDQVHDVTKGIECVIYNRRDPKFV